MFVLSIFNWYGYPVLCGPHSRCEEEFGRATSIRSEKTESGMAVAMIASSADELPQGWKQCTFLLVYEVYEICLMLCALG